MGQPVIQFFNVSQLHVMPLLYNDTQSINTHTVIHL